ncbi:hypothetical protein F1188_07370 [Roseospira marina]|uniref:DUF3108 domain-containing protein n=1 Tax=Roseospira marina TaxID=140057 RepID=A0A5M6IDB4_9PROT|nr:DUF6134 family protein [Roseospira marina]KAA5606233.1 hypothetical protein F1188_07370 [Roseospira marina]MBB4314385.1 hypothetical protein [Roseospira marina]MBB5087545.1 hypothetical protein [Roseospira marina]
MQDGPTDGTAPVTPGRRRSGDVVTRRTVVTTALLAGLLAGFGAGLAPRPAAAQAVPDGYTFNQRLTYRIFRGDSRIGQTVFEVYARGADRTVVTRTVIKVSVLVYSYASQHVATEVWENGELVRLETKTDDDGDAFHVEGTRVADGFQVIGSEGTVVAPPRTPPKSFWNYGILSAKQVITTKRGALAPVKTTQMGREHIAYRGGSVDATRFRFETDDVIDLWYTDEGLLVKAQRDSFGSDILYLLDTTGG